jgi:GNAT superfamily N-acetyltransferase
VQIRSLNSVDADALFQLRREALLDAPLAFSASPEDDIASSEEAVRAQLENRTGSLVFGAFEGGLHGMLGINRARHIKSARKAYLWGMYVKPQWRAQGAGAALLSAAITHARGLSGVRTLHLSVSEAAPEALRLYERAGFRIWATEPDSIQVGERLLSEYHMLLKLPSP